MLALSQYAFTPAEERLALALLRGEQLCDYAARNGITMDTARTHLKRVFDKTSTNRQSQLILHLLDYPLGRPSGED